MTTFFSLCPGRNILFFLLVNLAVFVCPLHAGTPNRVFVLCYHTFRGDMKDPYDLSLEQFDRQLDELTKLGYRFITADDLDNGTVTGKKNILLTIDDGNRSVLDAYEKVLRPRGIRPVLFIYAHIIGRKGYALRWGELEKLAKEGAAIGAHGYFHERLTEEWARKEPLKFRQEIVRTQQEIKERLGLPLTLFSYPFGVVSAQAQEELATAGYRYAFTLINRPIPLPISNKERFLLPRYLITRDNWKNVLAALKKRAVDQEAPSLRETMGPR